MDLGYSVQMNPYNAFLWPLEASKRPKTGLKITNFHGFEPHTPSGKLFWVDHGGSLPTTLEQLQKLLLALGYFSSSIQQNLICLIGADDHLSLLIGYFSYLNIMLYHLNFSCIKTLLITHQNKTSKHINTSNTSKICIKTKSCI